MRIEADGGVVTLTFDRPETLNALSAEDVAAATEGVRRAGADPSTRVVVLAGEGRAFCSGAAVDGLADMDRAGAERIVDGAAELTRAILECPAPVVALARGVVAGVGVPIALAADLVISDEEGFWLLAFTRIGLMPDGGSTAIVAASIGRARAMRMALLAERLPAPEALAAGLVSHVFAAADYDERAGEVIATLRDGPAVALASAKAAINQATLAGLEEAWERERHGQVALLLSPDFVEGASAFAQRRRPAFADRRP